MPQEHHSNEYRKGYNAGYKKQESEQKTLKKQLDEKEQERRDRFFCAALTGLLSKGDDIDQAIRNSHITADEAMES